MEFRVLRLYDGGVRVEKHVREAGQTCGALGIKTENIGASKRPILVARLTVRFGQRSIPALYEVQCIGTSGESIALSGHERIEAGPMRKECLVGQTWLLEPAPVQDLMDAEAKWLRAVREANELRERVAVLTAQLEGLGVSPQASPST